MPWVTGFVAALALVVYIAPGGEGLWALERGRTLNGEAWRLWTGHLVHFGAAHLAWDLLVVVVAGGWAERVAAGRTRPFYLIAPPIIAAVLLVAAPELTAYGGLSGVGVGLVALLAVERLRGDGRSERWFWWMVLAVVGAKLALESGGRLGPLTPFADPAVRSVPLAHAAGLVCGVGFGLARKR